MKVGVDECFGRPLQELQKLFLTSIFEVKSKKIELFSCK